MEEEKEPARPKGIGIALIAVILLVVLLLEWLFTKLTG